MKYFAYGSNMFLSRIRERTPSAKLLTTGILFEHKLIFHKSSYDGSGKCDACQTDKYYDHIYGVVYEIPKSEKQELDLAEGLDIGYEEKKVSIFIESKKTIIEAITYYATEIDASLKPYHWYKNFVLAGAIENNLPDEYVDFIQKTPSLDDPDVKRAEINAAILSKSKN